MSLFLRGNCALHFARSPSLLCRSVTTSVIRFLHSSRSVSYKTGKSTEENYEQKSLQRSVLEEILVKNKPKPTSFTGKITEKASNTFLYVVVATGLSILGVFIYLLAGEFFADGSPQKVYSSALALIRKDESCLELFGPTIAGFGEETSRGRRRHVAHHKYEKDGKQRIRVRFHLKGDRDEGIAQAEMEQQGGKWQWRFLYVETRRRTKTIHMNDDGFKVVRYSKRYPRGKNCEPKQAERLEGSLEDIEIAMKKAEMQMESSGLSSWVVSNIRSLLGSRQVTNIYVIGNGHFDAPWEPGTHQLALIQRMCREFDARIIFQEPCISEAEREYLSKQVKVFCRDSTDVHVQLADNDLHSVCVVVLIHGLHSILNDFLSFVWQSTLHNIILICNDYKDFDLIDGVAEKNSSYHFLTAFCKYATFLALPEYIPYPLFFINSSLAYVKHSVSLQELVISA